MFVFADETGNTGQNIFDPNQPFYSAGALCTRADFDLTRSRALSKITRSIGADALHAQELGAANIEMIAPEILQLLRKADARFVVARVEKKYLACTKIFDTVFDSYENRAVPWQAYNIRPLKLILVFKLAYYVFDERSTRLFWDCLMHKNYNEGRRLFVEACSLILSRTSRLPDIRARELSIQAFQWAHDNPEAFHFHSRGDIARYGHLPNVVGFIDMLDGIEAISRKWSSPVHRLTHDRQSQFERSYSYWHDLVSGADPEPIKWPSMPTHSAQRLAGSTLLISSAAGSAGVQIADLVLWLLKRARENASFGPRTGSLLQYLFRKTFYSDLGFDGVDKSAGREMQKIMETPMTEEQLSSAQSILTKMEHERETSLQSYADNKVKGLEPSERPISDMHSVVTERMFSKRTRPLGASRKPK